MSGESFFTSLVAQFKSMQIFAQQKSLLRTAPTGTCAVGPGEPRMLWKAWHSCAGELHKKQLGTFVEQNILLDLLSTRKELGKSVSLTMLDAGYRKGRFALFSQWTPFRSELPSYASTHSNDNQIGTVRDVFLLR